MAIGKCLPWSRVARQQFWGKLDHVALDLHVLQRVALTVHDRCGHLDGRGCGVHDSRHGREEDLCAISQFCLDRNTHVRDGQMFRNSEKSEEAQIRVYTPALTRRDACACPKAYIFLVPIRQALLVLLSRLSARTCA